MFKVGNLEALKVLIRLLRAEFDLQRYGQGVANQPFAEKTLHKNSNSDAQLVGYN